MKMSMKAAMLLCASVAFLAGCEGWNMHYESINKKPVAAKCEMACCKDKAEAMMADGKCCMDCCMKPATTTAATTEKAGHVH